MLVLKQFKVGHLWSKTWTLLDLDKSYIFRIYGHYTLLICIWFPWERRVLTLKLLIPCVGAIIQQLVIFQISEQGEVCRAGGVCLRPPDPARRRRVGPPGVSVPGGCAGILPEVREGQGQQDDDDADGGGGGPPRRRPAHDGLRG